jgi:mRNA interferase MazF
MEIKQYQILLVDFDPTVGSEIKKTRPCVVISPNEMNRNLQTLVVAPMTTQSKRYPSRIEVKHNGKDGWIIIDQIRTIDKSRIVKVYDKLSAKEIEKVKTVIRETFVD